MSKFIAIIYYTEACDSPPSFEFVEAEVMEAAWDKLIKSKWGDYDPRLGGFEDPRKAVKNSDWCPVKRVIMYRVLDEGDSAYFDDWYDAACAIWNERDREETEATEKAEFERLKKKFGDDE